MRDAETVTFGGSALDRAAELRGDAAGLAALGRRPGARAMALWRGKTLIRGPREALQLARLPVDHAIFTGAPEAGIFLGRHCGEGLWARDISDWQPESDISTVGAFLDASEQPQPAAGEDARFVELRAAMTHLSPRDAEVAATAKAILGWHETHRFCARCGAASTVAMAGWQRDCAACGGHHFPRTDPVVIMLVTRGDAVLLGRSPAWPERMFSLLAGFVEPGETVEAAVRREVWEEAAVRVGRVEYLASQPWPFPASLMIGCRAEALSTEVTLDPVELEATEWVGRERLARIFRGADPAIRPPRAGAIAQFLLSRWLADRLD